MANTESTVQIIPYYSHPHVHTVIVDNTVYDETVASTVQSDDLPFSTVVVTGADSGIDNTFVRLNSLATKQALFGKGNFSKYGQSSIQADVLFNGSTNVWFCRVLPDNATYANAILLAHYRKGKILDDLGLETGKSRLEIKFEYVNATSDLVTGGTRKDDDIEAYANTLASATTNPKDGYMTVPLFFVRSIGRGKYGNDYSISVNRDLDAEKEYGVKMYRFDLISNDIVTRIINSFAGSLTPAVRNNASTMINDVLDQYSTGSVPVSITPFTANYEKIFNFYKEIVAENIKYYKTSGGSTEDEADLVFANSLTLKEFDPLFGFKQDTRTDELIPFYRNYSTPATGAWVAPDLEIPDEVGHVKPTNLKSWNNAYVGARVLVAADPLHDGYRWLYTVMSIDSATGNIIYDEGEECAIDADQYDGANINRAIGYQFAGGHDGDFEEITVDGTTRTPTDAEMKLLLSREYVKAFRGEKDRKILSPARVDLDFMFDANYNMTNDTLLNINDNTVPLSSKATILTDKDAAALVVLGTSGASLLGVSDLNVKKAMYDLNEFRNRNGMTINLEQGAGCSLYLDCGLVGLKAVGVNDELADILSMMEEFDGRQTSVDLGYYAIFDPQSGQRINVTVTYFLAKNLIPHLMRYGLNKPFTYNYAQLRAFQRDNTYVNAGEMIRDTFAPDIDLIDWDVKEKLYKSRINYYLTEDEGRVVQRAVQNTRQLDASALLEENNVRVLNRLKKGLEKACRGYLFEWNEPEVRKGYTQAQMEVYRPWIGTMVQDLQIQFTANEWEQERMIMHCYVVVKFRDIVKRIILEINIQRPTYETTGGES